MDRLQPIAESPSSGSWISKIGALVLSLSVMSWAALPSQQKTPGQAPRESSFPGLEKKEAPAPVEPGTTPAVKTPAGKVTVKQDGDQAMKAILYETKAEVGLRNIPNLELDPVFKERLPKGTLLWLLAKEEGTGFTRVSVLGGFPGYVFAKYCRPDGEGFVEVTGNRLAFRAQPTTKGWPIDNLRKGTRLPLLSREGDWYKVLSNPEVGALVPDSRIQKVTSLTIKPGGELASFATGSDLLKRAKAQSESRQAAWTAVREKRVAESKREASIREVQQEIGDLRVKMTAEMDREDPTQRDLAGIAPLLEVVRKHVKSIEPVDPGLAGSLAAVEAEYDRLQTIAKAEKVMAEKLPEPKPVQARNASAKRGFSQSGWVRYRPGAYSSFQLVKGGEVLCYLVCDNRRYNLKDYVGCELGVNGPLGPREGADFKVQDVSRIHVLSSR